MIKSKTQDTRFKFYHQLDEFYHQLLDQLAQTELTDGEIGKSAQIVMISRQEALKPLVSEGEMAAYYEEYPQDQ